MSDVNLKLTIDEANLVLEALGNMPFARVYTLIGKIQQQAEQQINTSNGQNSNVGIGSQSNKDNSHE